MARSRIYLVIGLVQVLLLVPAFQLVAQPASAYLRRGHMATQLTTAAGTLTGPFPDTALVVFNRAQTGTIVMRGIDGRCDTLLDADTLRLIATDANSFTFHLLRRDADTMHVPRGSHQLVCDLNEVFLRRMWLIDFINYIGVDRIQPPTTGCQDLDGHSTQKFFMGGKSPLTAGDKYIDSMQSNAVGFWYLKGQSYSLPNAALTLSQNYLGSSLMAFNDNSLSYIARYDPNDDPPQRDSAKMARAKVTFTNPYPFNGSNPYPDDPSGLYKRITEIELTFQTQEYSSECSVVPGSEPQPLADRARFTLSYKVVDVNNSSTTYACTRDFDAHATAEENNQDLWEFYSANEFHNIYSLCQFDVDSLGYLTFKVNDGGICDETNEWRIMRVRNPLVSQEYCDNLLPIPGAFSIDEMTGEMMYLTFVAGEDPLPVPCFEFCERISGYETIANVVDADAATYRDIWSHDSTTYRIASAQLTWPSQNTTNNNIETGTWGKWRADASYVYRTKIKKGAGSSSDPERNWDNAGVYLDDNGSATNGLRMFNWQAPSENIGTKWIRTDSILSIAPHGVSTEVRNILDLNSATRLSHANSVVKLAAYNASMNEVDFGSFEDHGGNCADTAHSGHMSYKLALSGESESLIEVVATDRLKNSGLLVQVWVKRTYKHYSDVEVPISTTIGPPTDFTKIAQTGEWALYEKVLDLAAYTTGAKVTIKLENALQQPTQPDKKDQVWVDDIKAQPLDARMTCYVYEDLTLRPLGELDENHFGTYVRYNGLGMPVGRIRETEKGRMTIAEQLANMPDHLYRDGEPAPMSRVGGSGLGQFSGGATKHARASRHGMDSASPTASGASADLVTADIGIDRFEVGILGSKKGSLPSLDQMSIDSLLNGLGMLEEIGADELTKAEKLMAIEDVYDIDQSIDSLHQRGSKELSKKEQEQLDAAMEALRKKRRELLSTTLKISEQELQELYRVLGVVRDQEEQDAQ